MPGLKLGKEAQAKFDEARERPDFEGYLEKKGAKYRNWKKRWFVLKDNYLFYCTCKNAMPQGIINLQGCVVAKVELLGRPNSFSLTAVKSVSIDAKWTNRVYLISASSNQDLTKWMQLLNEAGRRGNQSKSNLVDVVQNGIEEGKVEKKVDDDDEGRIEKKVDDDEEKIEKKVDDEGKVEKKVDDDEGKIKKKVDDDEGKIEKKVEEGKIEKKVEDEESKD